MNAGVAAVLFLLSSCTASADQVLNDASLLVSGAPLALRPARPLATSGHFNLVCLDLPSEYQVTNELAVRTPGGLTLIPKVTVSTTLGTAIPLESRSRLNASVCFSSPALDRGATVVGVTLSSDAPLPVSVVRWLSTDKL